MHTSFNNGLQEEDIKQSKLLFTNGGLVSTLENFDCKWKLNIVTDICEVL